MGSNDKMEMIELMMEAINKMRVVNGKLDVAEALSFLDYEYEYAKCSYLYDEEDE